MNYLLPQYQIIQTTESVFRDITLACDTMEDELFFRSNHGRWSAAENLEHLSLSVKQTWKGMSMPGFLIKLLFGKPTRSSITLEALHERYNQMLDGGAQASGPYLPATNLQKKGKNALMEKWQQSSEQYLNRVRYYWEEHHLDSYQFPHPLLGKITARELMYFTIFHSRHHLNSIRLLTDELPDISGD